MTFVGYLSVQPVVESLTRNSENRRESGECAAEALANLIHGTGKIIRRGRRSLRAIL
jgi:hypothetical protein